MSCGLSVDERVTDRREAEHDVKMTSDTGVVVAVEVVIGRRPARELFLHHRHQLLEYLVHLVASEQVRHLRNNSVVYATPANNSVVDGDNRSQRFFYALPPPQGARSCPRGCELSPPRFANSNPERPDRRRSNPHKRGKRNKMQSDKVDVAPGAATTLANSTNNDV